MRRVLIESPLAGDYIANKAYARACMLDSLSRGESPYASHLLWAQAGLLNDEDPEQRKAGIDAGFAWGEKADLIAVYTDKGISSGMQLGIAHWEELGIPIEERSIGATAGQASGVALMVDRFSQLKPGSQAMVLIIDPDRNPGMFFVGGFHHWELVGLIKYGEQQVNIMAAMIGPLEPESDEPNFTNTPAASDRKM